jgi:anti-sigma factor RsiW
MNCTDFNQIFDDYLDQNCDGSLSQAQMASAEAHLAACSSCAAAVKSAEELAIALRQMPVVGPAEDYERRVLSAARLNGTRSPHSGFLRGFGSAVAAGLALWVVVALYPAKLPNTRPLEELPELTIALSQQQDVKVAFRTTRALQGATITIQVPEDVALVGHPGQRELSWRANLVEGENLLRLPVLASRAMQGQLVARIEHGNKVKTLRINLKASAKGLSGQGVLIEQLV